MRLHSHWFRDTPARPPEELARAAAIVAWRLARAALQRMRGADFQIDAGPRYFDFLAEFLAFLLACADRVAYAHLGAQQRGRFTQALGLRLAEIWAENRSELTGEGFPQGLIECLNDRGDDYASCACPDGSPDFTFLRVFASAVAATLPERDQAWVHDQVMEIEGPEAAKALRQALVDLLGLSPRRKPRGATLAAGD